MLLLHLLFAMRTDENKWSCGSREEELLKTLRCVIAVCQHQHQAAATKCIVSEPMEDIPHC